MITREHYVRLVETRATPGRESESREICQGHPCILMANEQDKMFDLGNEGEGRGVRHSQ